MNFRENFINDLRCGTIIKGNSTFKQLANIYGYPRENGENLCKKDYYRFLKSCHENTTVVRKGFVVGEWVGRTTEISDKTGSVDNNRDNSKTTPDLTKYNLTTFKIDKEGKVCDQWYKSNDVNTEINNSREELINDLKKVLELSPSKYTFTNHTIKSTQVFFISDLHIGMDSDGWNVEAATNRILAILNRINNADKVIIVNLGDTIDGLNGSTATKSTHTLPQNLSNSKQIVGAVEVFKILFDNLDILVQNNIIKEVEYYSVSDSNHSGDMELVISEFMKLYLNSKYPYIKVNNSDDYWNYIRVDDFDILISHGKDSKNMKFGLPLNLDYKTENYLTQLVNSRDIQLNPNKTLIVSGDLHTESFNQGKFFKYYKMPAISPPSTWVKMNYGDQISGLKYFTITGDVLNEGLISYDRK